jgi:hypothetical protein
MPAWETTDVEAKSVTFFHAGERYRGVYWVEHVVPFFDGELAVAERDDQRFYLQAVGVRKQVPPRAIQQYREFNHPLVLPFVEAYNEERFLVLIRPYEPIHPLREVISTVKVDEDRVVEWGKKLLQLEMELRRKAFPMFLLLDPRNIGMSERDELKVIYLGIREITSQPPTLDWGSFFYSLLSGQYLEEPIGQLPPDFPVSRPMARLIQRSLNHASPEMVLTQIEQYERKKQGKGLWGRWFGSEKEGEREEQTVTVVSDPRSRTLLPATGETIHLPPVLEETDPRESRSLPSSPEILAAVPTVKKTEVLPAAERTEESKSHSTERERLAKELLEEAERLRRERIRLEEKRHELECWVKEQVETLRREWERREKEWQKRIEQEWKELREWRERMELLWERLDARHEEAKREDTFRNDLLTRPFTGGASLIDPETVENMWLDKEEAESILMDREKEAHEKLARQFEEYMHHLLQQK